MKKLYLRVDALAKLQQIVSLQRKLAEREQEVVAKAKELGATWDDIAAVLGVTKQAAHFKYAEKIKGRK